MAEKEKSKYTALVGMNLGCSPKNPLGQRIEIGEAIPSELKANEIDDLLSQGAIAEQGKEVKK